MTNREIARYLRREASKLARSGNNLYRIRAFRQAAMTVLALPDEVASLVARGGAKSLEQVPGIGHGLANRISRLAVSERASDEFGSEQPPSPPIPKSV